MQDGRLSMPLSQGVEVNPTTMRNSLISTSEFFLSFQYWQKTLNNQPISFSLGREWTFFATKEPQSLVL